MKINSLSVCLLLMLQLLAINAMSQTLQTNRVKLDTINVSGKITSGDGRQLANITLITTAQSIHYIGVKANTTTDSLGNFSLKALNPLIR